MLAALERQLMRDELLAAFMAAFVDEWEKIAAKFRDGAMTRDRERSAVQRRISNLVEAISDGRASPSIVAKLSELEAQLAQLQTEDTIPASYPFPASEHIAEAYRQKIGGLKAALADGSDPEALEAARAMIDKVLIWPPETDGDPPGIELVGELLAMLQAGVGGSTVRGAAARPDPAFAAAVSSVKDGTGAKPLALLHVPRSPMGITRAPRRQTPPPCRGDSDRPHRSHRPPHRPSSTIVPPARHAAA